MLSDLIRFGSGIELTKKFCVRFRSMAELHRTLSFDRVRWKVCSISFDVICREYVASHSILQ